MNRARSIELARLVWADQAEPEHDFVCAICREDVIPVLNVTETVPYFRHKTAQEACDLSVLGGGLRSTRVDRGVGRRLRLVLEGGSRPARGWRLRLWLPSHDQPQYSGTIEIPRKYERIDLKRLLDCEAYEEFFCDVEPSRLSYVASAPHNVAFGAMNYLNGLDERGTTVSLNAMRKACVFQTNHPGDDEVIQSMEVWYEGAELGIGNSYLLLTDDASFVVPEAFFPLRIDADRDAQGSAKWGLKWRCFEIRVPLVPTAQAEQWLLNNTGFSIGLRRKLPPVAAKPELNEPQTNRTTTTEITTNGSPVMPETHASLSDDYQPIEDRVNVQVWSIRRLTEALEGSGREVIYIPTFQRGVVWKLAQRRKLIESIKQHYPVGSLLLYEAGFIGNRQKYQIVDGLQRSKSLMAYCQNQLKDFIADDLDPNFIEGVINRFNLILPHHDFDDREQMRNRIRKATLIWLRECSDVTIGGGFSAAGLAQKLAGICEREMPMSIMAICEKLLADIKLSLDISAFELPVIIFSGDRMKLPDIFKRLNTGGVQLNKYDILGCLWDGQNVEIHNTSVLDMVRKRQRLIDMAAEIQNERAIRIDRGEIDFFDFLCAVGSTLSANTPTLFPAAKEASRGEPEPHGFSVAALSFAIDSKTDKFERLPDYVKARGSCDDFLEGLVTAAGLVWKSLAPMLSLNIENTAVSSSHKELQMAAMVASIFRAMDSRTSIPGAISMDKRLQYLRQHYIADAFRSFWSGSGDAKALRMVKEDAFARPVSSKAMQYYFKSWHSELIEASAKQKKPSAKFNVSTTLFLKAYAAASNVPTTQVIHVRAAIAPSVLAQERLSTAFNPVNVLLVDSHGSVIADPDRHLPAPSANASGAQLTSYFERRLNLMIDTIISHYGFSALEPTQREAS